MASSNTPEAVATEHFDFGSSAADLGITRSRNIRSEVNNKSFDPEEVISAFEAAKGIAPRQRTKFSNYLFKNIVLDPEQEKDREMLDTLLNDPRYIIQMYKDNWTVHGTYRLFLIYGNLKEEKDESVH